MTREEAIERARREIHSTDMWGDGVVRLDNYEDTINDIYDAFEARTCESCRFFKIDKLQKHIAPCSMFGINVRDEMNCGMFEHKENTCGR